MNTLKRFTATLVASVDRTVTHMQDHEAVVAAAIRDSRKATARARFKLEKLKADNRRLHDRIHSLQHESDQWSTRAISISETSQQDALKCIAHRNRCTGQIESLSMRLAQQQQLEQQSVQTVQRLADKTDALNSKRTQLSSRAAAAEATRVIHRLEGDEGIEIDDTLDRWEQSVYETEAVCGVAVELSDMPLTDDLTERLASEEEQQHLQDELNALLAQNDEKTRKENGHD